MVISHVLVIYIISVGVGTIKTHSVQDIYYPLNKAQGKENCLNPPTNGKYFNILMIVRKSFQITDEKLNNCKNSFRLRPASRHFLHGNWHPFVPFPTHTPTSTRKKHQARLRSSQQFLLPEVQLFFCTKLQRTWGKEHPWAETEILIPGRGHMWSSSISPGKLSFLETGLIKNFLSDSTSYKNTMINLRSVKRGWEATQGSQPRTCAEPRCLIPSSQQCLLWAPPHHRFLWVPTRKS